MLFCQSNENDKGHEHSSSYFCHEQHKHNKTLPFFFVIMKNSLNEN